MAEAVLEQPTQAIDWNLIQNLYVQGVGPKEISARTGVKSDTISSRASRYNWRKLALTVKEKLQAPFIEGDEQAQGELQGLSNKVRKALGRDLARLCDMVEDTPTPNIKAALKRQRDLQPAVANGKILFGWAESQSQGAINIAILSSAQVDTPKPVLDVESVPSQEPTIDSFNPKQEIVTDLAYPSFDPGI